MASSASATRSRSKTNVFLFSLIVFLLLALPFDAVAQQAEGVSYVVQPGDTLSSIALRFDVSVDEIVAASGISDPNNLHVGDILIIPGIDWIEGTLLFQDMPLGESYLSIKRRYLLSDANMARLNRLTSPDQLYAGFPAMFATDRGELLNSARVAVGEGQSLLEIAAANGDNPWRLVAVNQLPGTWAAIPGDVIFTPGKNSPGPGGLPSPITGIGVDDPGFVQGHTAEIWVDSPPDLNLSGSLVDSTLHFFPVDSGFVALQGIALESGEGTYTFTLTGRLPDDTQFSFSQPIRVESGNFATARLSITDTNLLDAELSAAETAQVREFTEQVTPAKMWSGLWGWPHDLVNEVTDEFGIFRIYNGGVYSGFHYGTDFGGGALLSIYAPASGKVVFAGPLDIRGNATIIDHGWGIFTAYYHQMEILVNVGETVSPGQEIGIVGKTGRVSGPHLHWEVWVGGVPVEPLDWLNRVFP